MWRTQHDLQRHSVLLHNGLKRETKEKRKKWKILRDSSSNSEIASAFRGIFAGRIFFFRNQIPIYRTSDAFDWRFHCRCLKTAHTRHFIGRYLLVLMKTAVFFILLKKALSHIPRVSGVSEHEMTMKSLSVKSVSRGTVTNKQKDKSSDLVYVPPRHIQYFFVCKLRAQTTSMAPPRLCPQPFSCFGFICFLTKFSIELSGVSFGCSSRVEKPFHSKWHEAPGNRHPWTQIIM